MKCMHSEEIHFISPREIKGVDYFRANSRHYPPKNIVFGSWEGRSKWKGLIPRLPIYMQGVLGTNCAVVASLCNSSGKTFRPGSCSVQKELYFSISDDHKTIWPLAN